MIYNPCRERLFDNTSQKKTSKKFPHSLYFLNFLNVAGIQFQWSFLWVKEPYWLHLVFIASKNILYPVF